jgi:superfamily I DNA/RNA helicase
VVALISRAKGQSADTAELAAEYGAKAAFAYAFYQRCLAASGHQDMDDLVPSAVALLRADPDIHAKTLQCAPLAKAPLLAIRMYCAACMAPARAPS